MSYSPQGCKESDMTQHLCIIPIIPILQAKADKQDPFPGGWRESEAGDRGNGSHRLQLCSRALGIILFNLYNNLPINCCYHYHVTTEE